MSTAEDSAIGVRSERSRTSTRHRISGIAALCLFALTLPWLMPIAGGPSSAVQPWLFSALCCTIAFAAAHRGMPHPGVTVALAAISIWTMGRSGLVPETVAFAAACLLVYFAARVAASSQQEQPQLIDSIALSWLVAAGISTGIALLQYFGAASAVPGVSAAAVGEAFGNLRQRNQFATLTAMGMASLFWMTPRSIGLGPSLAAMAWLAVGNAATTSRTGLVQMILLVCLAAVWTGPRRQRRWLWLTGFSAYAIAAVLLPILLAWTTGEAGNRLWERVASVDSCSSRLVLWSNVVELVSRKPWFGWGWGELDYAHYMTLYSGGRFCDILDNAHNLPLHLAVELGLPVALLACGGFACAIVRARPWRATNPAAQMAWGVLAVILVHSLLEYPLWYGPFQIAFGLCLGLLWHMKDKPIRTGTGTVLLALAACAAVAFAAWDYWRVSQIYLPSEARAPRYRDNPLPDIRHSWLFSSQARFAELTLGAVTPANAKQTYDMAQAMLHYSPESRVIEKLVESGLQLGRHDDVAVHLARWRAAFPEAYAEWLQTHGEAVPTSEPAR